MDTSHVTDMSQMFLNCRSLKKLDLTSFNTKQVRDMSQMFAGCEALEELDLTTFDTQKVQKMDSMFESADALKSLKIGEKFVVPKDQEHTLKLKNHVWIEVGSGTSKNPKPVDKAGINSIELLSRHDKGNWVIKPAVEYHGSNKVAVANNLHEDLIIEVPEQLRPEYVGSTFELNLPQKVGFKADKQQVHVKATEEGLVCEDQVNFQPIEQPELNGSLRLASTVEPVEKDKPAKPIETVEPEDDSSTVKGAKFMQYITVHPDLKYAQTYKVNGEINVGHQLRPNYSWFSDKMIQVQGQKYYHVLGNSFVKAEDVYLYRDARQVVKTKDVMMTHLYNSRAKMLSNRGLGALSSWPVAKEVILNDHKYYQISTNEFVDSETVDLEKA
ncbi:BspA family leucine-rich repeat surface protein [Companilactobacillus sp. FL22-1]|uniref:BspA family leucine-rich repeat surface protein n=1 Tax=Companilactobacillus sp. FL22-1 TaxID=3373892 RepID=UPI003754EC0D